MRLADRTKNYTLLDYKKDFESFGIVDVTTFFLKELINELSHEIELLSDRSIRKDFLSKHTNSTPRNMYVVNEKTITENSELIKNFYYASKTMEILSSIAGEMILPLPWMGERFVIIKRFILFKKCTSFAITGKIPKGRTYIQL